LGAADLLFDRVELLLGALRGSRGCLERTAERDGGEGNEELSWATATRLSLWSLHGHRKKAGNREPASYTP
jgi:hypothetical protein